MDLTKFLRNAVILIFLCKTADLLPKDTSGKRSARDASECDSGWHKFDHYCYNVIANLTSWENASVQCSSTGGYLASIHSEQQNDFITHLMMNHSVKNWWIGLHDPEWGVYAWEDGSDVDFSSCETPELNNLCLMSDGCIEMFVYAQGRIKGLWRDAECNKTKSYVCQKRSKKYPIEDPGKAFENNSSLCEEGWHQYDQVCYMVEKNALNWLSASSRCYNKGGSLASIHSRRQNDFLADLIFKNFVRHSWIGLHDQIHEGYYVWEDGSDIDYTRWRQGEPSGHTMKTAAWYYSKDDCVTLEYPKHKGISGGWADSSCDLRRPYICQKQIPELSNGSSAVTSLKKKSPCDEGWLHNGEFCYKLVRISLTWHDASLYCAGMDGNLTSIHSQEQQDFIAAFIMRQVTTNLWIGLHDFIAESNYTWVDGNSINYLNWGRGEPSGYFNHMEDCVEMSFRPRSGYTGQWNDMSCSTRNYFICQKQMQGTVYKNKRNDESQGFVSVATFYIVITFVIISMALLGALCYYKRLWLEEQRIKIKTVLFRSSGTDTERLTEIDIKDNQNIVNEPIENYNFFK